MEKDSPNSATNQKPFQKFENLVRRLIRVPKDKVQKKQKQAAEEPPKCSR